jgi:hypothetical protein
MHTDALLRKPRQNRGFVFVILGHKKNATLSARIVSNTRHGFSLSALWSIYVLSMCHSQNKHYQSIVVNFVHHAIITDADSPKVVVACQLYHICRSRIVGQHCHSADDPTLHVVGQFLQCPGSRGFE